MSNRVVVLGTSRPAGNTRLLVDAILRVVPCSLIDLTALKIGPFDYEHRNQHDSFAAAADAMARHGLIVLATPVYWYAMSAQLKTFLDRFTDLIQLHKTLGHSFAGRGLAVIASGTDSQLPEGFANPFALTAKYFSMHWRGAFYGRFEQDLVLPPEAAVAALAWMRQLTPSTE